MTFRELLELYRNGKLSEKEKPVVESEIEKFEALSDYVFSDVGNDRLAYDEAYLDNQAIEQSNSKETIFANSIRKQIRKVFIKMGAVILAILIVFILFIQFGLSPILESIYYNPVTLVAEHEGNSEAEDLPFPQQIELDFKVYSELNMPLENRNEASAQSLGFGEYSFSIGQGVFRDYENIKPAVGGIIKRGKIIFYDPEFEFNAILGNKNQFAYTSNVSSSGESDDGEIIEIPQDQMYQTERETFLDIIKEYDPDKMIKVTISFKDLIDFTKFLDIRNKYDLDQVWVAVKSFEEDSVQSNSDMGFSMDSNGSNFSIDEERYPYLRMINHYDETENEDIMTRHYLSMLKYMSEQTQFLKMLNENRDEFPFLAAYDYIESNGLEIYGCAAYVTTKNAERMINDGVAYDIQLMEFGQL